MGRLNEKVVNAAPVRASDELSYVNGAMFLVDTAAYVTPE